VIKRLVNEDGPCRCLPFPPPRAPDDVALAAITKPRTPIERITCFKCTKKGHYQRDCPQLNETASAAIDDSVAW
ncbi:hypothetical protein BN946_scf184730.g1, partial [Trametes cinnabarina]